MMRTKTHCLLVLLLLTGVALPATAQDDQLSQPFYSVLMGHLEALWQSFVAEGPQYGPEMEPIGEDTPSFGPGLEPVGSSQSYGAKVEPIGEETPQIGPGMEPIGEGLPEFEPGLEPIGGNLPQIGPELEPIG